MVEPSNAGNLTPVSATVADPAQAASHADSNRKHGPSPIRLLVLALIASGGLAWDLWSKHQVFATLGYPGVLPGPGVLPVWKGLVLGIRIQFQLETAFNHGALWGMGQGQTWLFASLSFVAVGVIAYFLWSGQVTASKWLTVATGLLLAGTLGNLFDRLGLHGYQDEKGQVIYAVRDFLDWFFGNFHWATFNFADMYLVVGAIMLVVHSFFVPPHETNSAASSTSP